MKSPGEINNVFQRNLDNFLGYFNIKSCDDLGASIVVQLNGKLPFTHVLINEKQAQMVGFTEGQEVATPRLLF